MYQAGDIAENFTLLDQAGEQVDLYSFCGQVVMISFGAMGCGPCQDLAAEGQALQDRYADDGFQMIDVLVEDMGGTQPAQSELEEWADAFGFSTIPVLQNRTASDYVPWVTYELDWGIPTTVMLGADMEVLSVDANETDPRRYSR